METRQAQRLLLFMGIVGAFAILMASWAVFGVSVETASTYDVEGIRARLLAVEPGTVDLSFLIAVMGLPLLVAGSTGWMLELRTAEKSVRWTMMAGVGVWVLSVAAFVGGIRIVSSGIAHLPPDTPWPAELEVILGGLSWLAMGTTLALWSFLSVWIARGQLPVPRHWAWLSPGTLLLAFLCLALAKGLISGVPASRGIVLAPWTALMISFVSLLVLRVRRPLG